MLQRVYATPIPFVRQSVYPSVTRVYCIKTAERIIEILSLSDRPITLVFGFWRKSDGFTPAGAPNTRGSDFQPICGYISKTVIDIGILTIEDENKVVCALSNSAVFDGLDRVTPNPSFKVTVQFKGGYLANGASNPLHIWFQASVFGSAERMALFPVRSMAALSRVTLASAGLSCYDRVIGVLQSMSRTGVNKT